MGGDEIRLDEEVEEEVPAVPKKSLIDRFNYMRKPTCC